MLTEAVDHLLHNVLHAAADYQAAERALSVAFAANEDPSAWKEAARAAKRRAAELAIAIDGLTDRSTGDLHLSKGAIRTAITGLCYWPGSTNLRSGAHDRVRGVATAYKHQNLSDPSLPITSDADVLTVALGYGLDGWGVGKRAVPEVLVRETAGQTYKFMGDAPVAISAWFKFLHASGAILPSGPYSVCNLQVHP